jgi:hypothetical protein
MPNNSTKMLWVFTFAVALLTVGTWIGTSYSQSPPEQPVTVDRSIAPSELPAKGRVQFPSGEQVVVSFRKTSIEPMTSVDLEQYPALLGAARKGNARSQAIVGRTLVYCAGVRGITFSTPNTTNLGTVMKDRTNSQKGDAREIEVREFCSKQSVNEVSSGIEWLKAAAAQGDTEAQTSLPSWYRFGSDEQIEALMIAWQNGSVTALRKLSNAYLYRSNKSGPESEDAVNAHAAAWLFMKLNETAFGERSGGEYMDAARMDFSRNFDRASPKVRDDAIATARRMLSQTTRCCSFP